jgi:uncharacterized coiled-coil protein SlyX
MQRRIILFLCMLAVCLPGQAFGDDLESRIRAMEETLNRQQKTIEEQQKIIQEMQKQIKQGSVAEKQEAGEKQPIAPVAVAPPAEQKPGEDQKSGKVTGLFGGSAMSNPNISLVLNTFALGSSETNDQLKNQGIPGYTTTGLGLHNGFNGDAEISLFAPVDPYFNLYATIPISFNGEVELEEAYFVTTSLPQGNQLKGGKFRSGFSRFNAQHEHAWDFTDTALPYRAFLGQEGLIEPGFQYTYILPLPVYTLVGAEILQGENATLFGQDAANGPHAFTGYAKTSFDIGDYSTLLLGVSAVAGKTQTDTVQPNSLFTGNSVLYDLEMYYKWKPSTYESFSLQSEYMLRNQYGNLQNLSVATPSYLIRNQDGFYVQGVYQRDRWRFGARYDALSIFTDEYNLAGQQQNFGPRPWRATAMVDWNLSEFTRIRLQYIYDMTSGTGTTDNQVFLQFIFGIGAHAAHTF